MSLMTTAPPPRDDHQQALLELRTLQKVAWELSRSLDLDVVLGRCLDLAMETAHADAGNLYLNEPARAVFQRVVGRNVNDVMSPLEFPASEVTPVFNTSSLQVEVTLDSQTPHRAEAYARGLRHTLLLALHVDGPGGREQVGFLSLLFRERLPLTDSTLQTLEAMARYEAMAISNARAHRLVERRSRMGEGLREFSERALGCAGPAELNRLILDSALALTRNQRGIISRVAEGTAKVVAASSDNQDMMGFESPLSAPYLRDVIESLHPVVCEDTSSVDPQSQMGRIIAMKGTRSYLTVAVRHGERPVGILYVSSPEPRRYQPEEIQAVQILATLAGQAMERVHALERLADEKQRLGEVLEHLPIVVAVIARDGGLIHFNAAGRAFAEEYGAGRPGDWRASMSLVQMLSPDGQPIDRDDLLIMRAFRGEEPPPCEELLLTPDGRRRNILLVAAPLRGPEGRVESVVAGFQDVTALRELADAKDRFLRIASHELRSPLTALRATSSLLEMDPTAVDDPERRALMLQRIHRQVDRLTRLVEQLIDSARLNVAEPPLERVETDLGALCHDAIAALPEAARVRLEVASPAVGLWDVPRLEQVLSNLLSNAARYSPPESQIAVRVASDGATARVEVSDHGIGIPPEQQERLFTPFFRASNAAAQSKGGLGLGLHIASEIVRRHGGRLTVRSQLGEGSTFVVELPVRS
jgi:signal transduction histidine kinase/GAF domain-containing protein